KTRLALELAAALADGAAGVDSVADGVWFVRLAPVSDPELVLPTIARTLGLQEAGGTPIQVVLRAWLRTRRPPLLPAHRRQGAAAGGGAGGGSGRGREGRGAAGGRRGGGGGGGVFPPPPLEAPPSPATPGHALQAEQLLEAAAVALFVERARAARPDFTLTEQ